MSSKRSCLPHRRCPRRVDPAPHRCGAGVGSGSFDGRAQRGHQADSEAIREGSKNGKGVMLDELCELTADAPSRPSGVDPGDRAAETARAGGRRSTARRSAKLWGSSGRCGWPPPGSVSRRSCPRSSRSWSAPARGRSPPRSARSCCASPRPRSIGCSPPSKASHQGTIGHQARLGPQAPDPDPHLRGLRRCPPGICEVDLVPTTAARAAVSSARRSCWLA